MKTDEHILRRLADAIEPLRGVPRDKLVPSAKALMYHNSPARLAIGQTILNILDVVESSKERTT